MCSRGRMVLGAALAVCAVAAGAPAASADRAGQDVPVRFERLAGFDAPGTPDRFNRVGIVRVGARGAPNVLVLNAGTSASAAYFVPLARTIVGRLPAWQVWAVERRENQLEDQSMANRAKLGRATAKQLFDYYLGYITDRSITRHFRPIPDARVGYARRWGMRVELEDLRRVVRAARRVGRRVVVGGHSLGATMTVAYATWDFGGRAGAADLDGLVLIDGGSPRDPVSVRDARAALGRLANGSPWLAFGGIPAPFAGQFAAGGGLQVRVDPDAPSIAQDFPLLPANLKPPVRATNVAQFGYALDVNTSPRSLAAAQAHLGRLAPAGDPRGWVRAGAITPIQRYADMFSGWGLLNVDGAAWYHPLRLTIDAGAVASGNANPAQRVLDVRAIHGRNLPRDLRIYAFGAALGGERVLDGARLLARQSRIPSRNLVLVNRARTYSHNDPNSAFPRNDFVTALVPFLRGIQRR